MKILTQRFSVFCFALLGILFWGGLNPISAQNSKPKLDTEDAELTNWTVSASKTADQLKVGDVFTISFKGHVKQPGWHLYSTQPAPNGMGYNPTRFEFIAEESKGIKISGQMSENPRPVSLWDDLMRDSLRYFREHDVTFDQKFKITGSEVKLIGEFSYQICVDPEGGGQCRFLALPFEYSFKIKDAGGNSNISPDSNHNSDNSQPEDTAIISDDNQDSGGPGNCCKDVKDIFKLLKFNGFESPEAENNATDSVNVPFAQKLESAHKRFEESGITVLGEAAEKKSSGCEDKNFWLIFFKAFLFGFAAVLTPCVFPMIPMTVTFFTKQKGAGVRMALMYGLFIIFIYTAVGLAVSVIFGADFLYRMSTNPWVNLGFFILLFIFALSFLGMFEITLPAGFVNKIDSQSDRGGIIGTFFMALTLALVSFSCTGPLVGTALIDAAGGGCIWGPILAMLGFSSALAIPFMLFAVFPGWLNSMPKSGGWLNSVKVVLGFLELALGLKFLSQADLVLKWHILDREIFLGAWIVIVFFLGLYLLGKLRLPHDSPIDRLSVPRMVLAIGVFWFGLYLVPGLWGAKLSFVSGILPPPNAEIGVKILGQKEMNEGTVNGKVCALPKRKYYEEYFQVKEHSGFCTFYDLEEGLAFAKRVNKPVFIDFTGHTCANCRQMEQMVWPNPEISKRLKEDFVMISLYVDEEGKLEETEELFGKKVRTIGRKFFQIQKEVYGMIAQPYYCIVDSDLENMVSPRAFDLNALEYKAFLEAGKKKFYETHPEGNK